MLNVHSLNLCKVRLQPGQNLLRTTPGLLHEGSARLGLTGWQDQLVRKVAAPLLEVDGYRQLPVDDALDDTVRQRRCMSSAKAGGHTCHQQQAEALGRLKMAAVTVTYHLDPLLLDATASFSPRYAAPAAACACLWHRRQTR